MERKLIAIDLDGTTLNNQSKVSKRTAEVFDKAREAGHVVSIVTGRPNRLSDDIYDGLHMDGPLINFNGSLGHDPHHQWAEEYQYTFDRDIALDLLKNREKFGIEMIAAEGKNLYLAMQDPKNPVNVGFFPSILQSNQILNQRSLTTNPTSLTIAMPRSKQQPLIDYIHTKFGAEVDVAPWGGPDSVIEIGRKGIQKATGVEVLADYYHIKRKDIIAFGDEHNDVAMIDYAGWGVVMKNGTDELKTLASDVTTKTNDEDGLADYLENYLGLAK